MCYEYNSCRFFLIKGRQWRARSRSLLQLPLRLLCLQRLLVQIAYQHHCTNASNYEPRDTPQLWRHSTVRHGCTSNSFFTFGGMLMNLSLGGGPLEELILPGDCAHGVLEFPGERINLLLLLIALFFNLLKLQVINLHLLLLLLLGLLPCSSGRCSLFLVIIRRRCAS